MNPPDISCLIPGKETGKQISVFQEKVPPNVGPPLHAHVNQLEIFHVISGTILFEIDGKREEVSAGETATIPPGVPHAFINPRDEAAVIHFELLPSGSSETFFKRLVDGDFEDPGALFEQHGLKLLGPPLA